MKKLIPALLIAAPLLIAGCGQSNSDENDQKHSDKSTTATTSDSENKSEQTTQKHYKEITLSDIFADGKPHILYRASPGVETGGEDDKHQPVKVNTNSLNEASVSQVIYVKNNQARQFFVYSNDDLRLGKFLKTSPDEVLKKMDHLAEIEKKDSDNMNPLVTTIDNFTKIEKFIYQKNHKVEGNGYNFSPATDGTLEMEPENPNLKLRTKEFKPDFTAKVKPFEYKGKTYAGISPYDGEILITEVPADTEIELETKKDKEMHVIDYKDSESGKMEADEKEKEFDNL
ncbi:hypothetical protein [Staphylococcus debuckii]|uniref:hypothetical protein n=1 Tax=Staphylococcus debuckii TaxID=2044912 RepID=UPI000F437E53|nr:hypothetical protein [Staphylococcus debuckii]AYU54028.1 hypothetical protein CNQ82_00665 [Staphylococcus debuckii]